jgi:hypothetical protein
MKRPFLSSLFALCVSAIALTAEAQIDQTAEKAAKAARAREEAAEKFRAGFTRLRFIEGTWKQANRTAASASAEPLFKITPYLGGKYLETHGNFGSGDFQMIFSYYQPGDHYLMSIVDDQSGVLDVYKGEFDASGALVFTNPNFFRISLIPTPGGNFTWVGASSRDQGATFKVNATYVLEKAS